MNCFNILIPPAPNTPIHTGLAKAQSQHYDKRLQKFAPYRSNFAVMSLLIRSAFAFIVVLSHVYAARSREAKNVLRCSITPRRQICLSAVTGRSPRICMHRRIFSKGSACALRYSPNSPRHVNFHHRRVQIKSPYSFCHCGYVSVSLWLCKLCHYSRYCRDRVAVHSECFCCTVPQIALQIHCDKATIGFRKPCVTGP